MLHYLLDLSQCTVEVCNDGEQIVFSRDGEVLLRLSFKDFDELLEAVARGEKF